MPIYSDINGFPESGFPVLSNESDYLVLNTLYSVPQKYLGYVMDVSGNNRLLGNLVLGGTLTGVSSLTMAGALSGVTTLAASSTVTLSSATAPLTISGANAVIDISGIEAVLKLTGERASIGTQFQRVNNGWFKNLDIVNRPTIGEDYVALVGDLRQYSFLSGRLGDILKIDELQEFTTANGVKIDGLILKDTGVNFEAGATTRIFKDGSNNLSFTDAVLGTKTLTELFNSSMVYPGAGIAVSTGSTWATSIIPSTGYFKYNGSAYQWVNETYSLSTHNHDSLYAPIGTVSSQWITSGSDIYYNSGSVAVGTATASHKFTIGGTQSKSGNFENLLSINSNDSANQLRLQFGLNNDATASNRYAIIQAIEEDVAYRNLILNADGGNVGIGRIPSTYELEVEGSTLIRDKLYLGTNTAPATDTGTLNSLVWDNTTGEIKQRAVSGGGTPGGSDTYVQFNDGGSFGGVSSFTFSKTNGTVTITPASYINYGIYINTSNTPILLKGRYANYYRWAISDTAFRIDGDSDAGFGTYKSIIVGDYAGGCDLYYNGSKKFETETYGTLTTGYSKADGFVSAYQSLTSSSSIAMNVRSGQNAKVTLAHNATLTLSNLVNGDEGNIIITQDTTGSRTLVISPTPKVINSGAGSIVLTGTANSIDILSYTYDGSRLFITKGPNYT